jgi:hypothetical protein
MKNPRFPYPAFLCAAALFSAGLAFARAEIGVGAKPITGAEVIIDGTRETLDAKWTYWTGPRFASALPIKWQIVADPVIPGTTVLMTDDRAADGGKYGAADIITKKAYRDFRLHIEFLVTKTGGNQNIGVAFGRHT